MEVEWDNMTEEQKQPTPHIDSLVDDDEWEYVDEFIEDDASDNSTVNEVTKRIEQAKLYESLLNHDFFAPGSARAEIQNKVTKEIRDFILERLTILVGIKAAPSEVPVQAVLPWSDLQIEALTSIADRLVEKKNTAPSPVRPVVQQFSGNSTVTPRVNVAPSQNQPQVHQTAPQRQQVRRRKVPDPQVNNASQSASAKKPLPPNVKIDPSTGNPVSENGIVLYDGQVQNKKKPPKAMPPQRAIDMMHANQVQRTGSGSSIGDKMLGLAISNAQNINRHVTEED